MWAFSWAGKESACNAGDPSSIPGLGRSPGEGIGYPRQYSWVSLVPQLVKNTATMWEPWVPSLGWEDALEKGMATHSSILAWRIPMDRGAWWATVMGSQSRDLTEWVSKHSTAQQKTGNSIRERMNENWDRWVAIYTPNPKLLVGSLPNCSVPKTKAHFILTRPHKNSTAPFLHHR